MRIRLAAALAAAGLAFAIVALTSGIGQGAAQAPAAEAGASSGRAVFARMGCGGCHTLAAAGSRGGFGPNLDERLPMHDRASLVAQITRAPSAGVEDFSMMPRNFGSRMNAAELNALVDFLLSVR